MHHVAVSAVGPFLSHVARQSLSCAPGYDPLVFVVFLCTYAVSMLAHGTWVDRASAGLARLVLLFSGITFAASVAVRAYAPKPYFVAAWALHAACASGIWPISNRWVTS